MSLISQTCMVVVATSVMTTALTVAAVPYVKDYLMPAATLEQQTEAVKVAIAGCNKHGGEIIAGIDVGDYSASTVLLCLFREKGVGV